MTYMVHARARTAIRNAYRDGAPDEIEAQLAQARMALDWVGRLDIDPTVRAALIEPIAVVEEAFAEIARHHGGTPTPRSLDADG